MKSINVTSSSRLRNSLGGKCRYVVSGFLVGEKMTMCVLTEDVLKQRTVRYWEYKGDKYDYYIKELLKYELQEAKKDPERLLGVGQRVHTLALTVGESFEPLLQVVCVLKPQRVVLVLNSFYGSIPGSDHGEKLKQLMVKLSESDLPEKFRPQLSNQNFDLIELPQDTPTHVFRALREALQKPEAHPPAGFTNVVDITGAKKSMVVGAFLYAAHSDLPITYVDFDEYDTDWGKPYGYTCRIGRIANPYEAFHLRDWEQVRQLYESYSFRNARALLGIASSAGNAGMGILGAMSQTLGGSGNTPLFDQSDIDSVKRLASLFEMYEAWENGDYAEAKRLKDSFNPPLPPDVVPWSIEKLGSIWPHVAGVSSARTAAQNLLASHLALKQGASSPSDSLFAKPLPLLAYVRDELAKIERLIEKNEDYRSAYLRAAGLEEFLLKARLCIAWLNDCLEVEIGNNSRTKVSKLPNNKNIKGFRNLVEHSGADAMRDTLANQNQNGLQLRKAGMKVYLANTQPLAKYWDKKSLDLNAVQHGNKPIFTKLRGEAIHTHLYIPRPIAEAALELVRAAVEEFETNWLEHFHPNTLAAMNGKLFAAPTWSNLCEVCDLIFLPPRLRQ